MGSNEQSLVQKYFFICTQYDVERNEMLQKINRILQANNVKNKITLELLVHGSKKLSHHLKIHILDAVQSFISNSVSNP